MIDAHAHLSNTDYGNVELYLSQLKEAGVDQGVVVPGGMMDVRKMTDYVIGKAKAENPVPDNDYVMKCCKDHPGIIKGFMCIDPHAENALGILQKGVREGFRGLKLNPMTHQFSFASKAIADLVAACANYGFPVYSHVLFSPGASTAKFVALARQFPKVNFILGHMGFGPADQEGLEAAASLNNFYLETSTGNYLHMKEAVKRAGPSKLIYGSEFPLSHPKAELEKILLLKLSGDAQDRVLGRNIQQMLSMGDLSTSTNTGMSIQPASTNFLNTGTNVQPRVNTKASLIQLEPDSSRKEQTDDSPQGGAKLISASASAKSIPQQSSGATSGSGYPYWSGRVKR